MLNQILQNAHSAEDMVGAHETRGAVYGVLVGALVGIALGVGVGVWLDGLVPLGLLGIVGAAKVGAVWGMVLGGYIGLLAKVREEELATAS